MVFESESIMDYLGFNPHLVDNFAELCDKALTEAGLLDMERDDVRGDIDELVRMALRDGMGYNGDFEPCDIIIDAIGQETCNELKELFPEEDFTYIADGVYSELHINGKVYDGTEPLNCFLQNYHNDQQLFENFEILARNLIWLSPDDLESALLRCGVTAENARDIVEEAEDAHDNPRARELIRVNVCFAEDDVKMKITDWTQCDWEKFWESGDGGWKSHPDDPVEHSVPLTKEERARLKDAMQREFGSNLKNRHDPSLDEKQTAVEH